jgi:hypothetical protein
MESRRLSLLPGTRLTRQYLNSKAAQSKTWKGNWLFRDITLFSLVLLGHCQENYRKKVASITFHIFQLIIL